MTQKELLYFEDAVGHECSIISILEDTKNKLEDSSLVDFIDNEITIHKNMKEELMNVLEEKTNEWSNINGKLLISS